MQITEEVINKIKSISIINNMVKIIIMGSCLSLVLATAFIFKKFLYIAGIIIIFVWSTFFVISREVSHKE